MIPITEATKTALKQPVKQVRAKINWQTSESDSYEITSEDRIISVKKEAEGYFLGSTLRKITIVVTGTDLSLIDQKIRTTIQVKTGANAWGDIKWGSFTIKEETVDQAKGTSTFVGYGGIADLQDTEYQAGQLTFPTTVAGLITQIAAKFSLAVNPDLKILPAEYQRVEYAEATQNTTVWINGLKLNGDSVVEADCNLSTTAPGDWSGVWACRGTNNSNTNTLILNKNQTGLRTDYYVNRDVSYSGAMNARHIFKADKADFYVDGVKILTGTYRQFQSTTKTSIFATNVNESGLGNYARGKFYSFKVTEAGALKCSLVPCIRKSDSVVGFYDLATATFIAPTSGTLTAGTAVHSLPNADVEINEDLWAKISGTTYRDILEQAAGATGTLAVISGGDDNIDFYNPPITAPSETLTEANLISSTVGENWGKVSAVVLSRQPQNDNIEAVDTATTLLPGGKNLFEAPASITPGTGTYTKINSNAIKYQVSKPAGSGVTAFCQTPTIYLEPNSYYTISANTTITGGTFNKSGGIRLNRENSWTSEWDYNGVLTFKTGNTGRVIFGFYAYHNGEAGAAELTVEWDQIQLEKTHNIFDATNYKASTFWNDNGMVRDGGSNMKGVMIQCKPNTTYAVSKSASGTNPRFALFTTELTPRAGIAVVDQAGQQTGANTATQYSIHTSNNAHWLVVFMGVANTTPTTPEMVGSVIITETPTAYEPFTANGRVDLVIANNEILDKQRETTITPILNAVKGWEYRNAQIKTEGHGYHEIGDRLDITIAGETHKTIVTKSTILINGGIQETLTSTTPEQVPINYAKTGGITKTIFNTELAVDKQEQRIDAIVSRQDATDAQVAEQFTQVTQDLESITATIQQSGGGNLIKNSVGFGKDSSGILTIWEYGTGASATTVRSQSSPASLNAGAVSGYEIMLTGSATISQSVALTPGETYTLSARAQKGITGSATITIANGTNSATLSFPNQTAADWRKVSVDFVPVEGANVVTITSTAGTTIEITDLMLATGGKTTWRQASGEIYNTQVSLDQAGVQVKSSVYTGDYVEITPLEFAGYSNASGSMQKVFSLNRDTTEVEKLEARSQLKMPPLKVVPIDNSNYKGWAFVQES